MNSDRHVLHVSSPFDKFMGLHTRNSESEGRMTLKIYSDYLGNGVNQVPFKGRHADLKLDCHLAS